MTSNCKIQIKNLVLGALADNHKEIRQVASQIIAKIGKIEIPRGLWAEVLQILITNGSNTNPVYKETALMTLGYICEELPGSVLNKKDADDILTVIIAGLSIEERNTSIIMTSLISLKNSIKFIKSNVELSEERKIILNALYGLCLHPSIEIRKESISVIDDIAYFYYDFIETDLMDLGNLTYNIIRTDEIPVALFAIEFWNILADIEAERIANKIPHKSFIFTAATTLVPILLEKVHIFDDDDDDDNE